jgi:ABC-type transporter Mla subunit MlaD
VPIPADTRAILRTKTLLGEAFVELSSGDRSGPKLPDGGTIPVANVQPTTSIDQLINSFDAPTRRSLEEFLSGAGASLSGTAAAHLNNAIGNLDPTVTELQAITQALDSQQSDIRHLISGSA